MQNQWDYGDYCPECMHNFGWDYLAEQFAGRVIDPDKELEKKIVCPNCDSVVLVKLMFDFGTKVVG